MFYFSCSEQGAEYCNSIVGLNRSCQSDVRDFWRNTELIASRQLVYILGKVTCD